MEPTPPAFKGGVLITGPIGSPFGVFLCQLHRGREEKEEMVTSSVALQCLSPRSNSYRPGELWKASQHLFA